MYPKSVRCAFAANLHVLRDSDNGLSANTGYTIDNNQQFKKLFRLAILHAGCATGVSVDKVVIMFLSL